MFVSSRDGDAEIFLMSADGTDIQQLTLNDAFDVGPSWSPDGTQILFNSTRDAEEDEIYTMNADGTDLRRLTESEEAADFNARWAPRKRGVEVSEASVVIPNASALKPLTAPEAIARALAAVVRIETDLGLGSGFIIDSDGLILTNNHVISDAEEVTVFLEDGTSFDGTILGRDLVRDLAVVKIEATDLTALELGTLSRVPLGSDVVVLGYPLGIEDLSVASGLVSSIRLDKGRNITWIQTDAAVNPGNSGGPLLNLQGQVIGVVSAKFVGAAIEGVGFAVSSNTVILYLDRLLEEEIVTNEVPAAESAAPQPG